MRLKGTADKGPAAESEDLAPEQLLAHRGLWRRLTMFAITGAVAAPILSPALIGVWVVLYLLAAGGEQLIVARRGYIGSDLPGFVATFALSVLHAWAAAELIRVGDAGAQIFAITLICFSAVNVLLRFYGSPRMFLGAIAPHVCVIGWVSWGIFARHLSDGAYLKALTAPAILLTYGILLVPAQRRLAEVWGRLLKAKTAAEAASRAKSNFLATMSHEIRTPLNGVLGMAQAMQREDLSKPQKERLRVIRSSGETLLSVLNDALDFSKIEAGQIILDADEFDMEHATRGAVATFTPLAASKGLSFEFSIDEAAKGVFRGDSVRLRQIVYNLASNAVKFTDAGGVAVGVSYADGMLRLEVADSGIGIAAEEVDGLFEEFVQGDSSATRRAGGAGLGLTICRALTELMGGRIAVSSVLGRGSIFTVALPLERLAGPQPVHVEETAAETEAAPELRILAAEDNAVNQLVLKTLLSQAGVEPTMVENGAEAVEAWKTGHWDVILMDIQMPVMDGVSATREIRGLEAAQGRGRVPIIAVTANAMPDQVVVYEAAGIDAVVAKPLDAAKLFEAIERALEPGEAHSTAAAA
jgi:signal transduction histidine kinase/ActR/RegA family two-component response regulator